MTAPPHVVAAGPRRAWSPEQKRAILAEADDPGTTTAAAARRHGLHSSLPFRRRCRPPATGAPVVPSETGAIEIELAGGHRVRVPAGADLTLLRGVLAALTG